MTGLRERKKRETRRALGMAAMRLAVERGLENVLVEDIAAAVGVSPRTVNNYFSSKYEAICFLAVERALRVGEDLRARPADEPLWEAITQAVLRNHESGAAPDKAWSEGVRLVTSSPALQGEYLKAQFVMRRALAEAIAERTGTDLERDMFPKVMAGVVTVAMDVAIDHFMKADPPVGLRALMERALAELASTLEG